MEQTPEKRRPGRPKGSTGTAKTKRNVRIGPVWDHAEELAHVLGVSMTSYVEQALRHENARAAREIRIRAEQAAADAINHDRSG